MSKRRSSDRHRGSPGRDPCRRDHRGGHAVVEGRQQGHLRRVLRQRQRPLHRRRGPHPRRRSRHGRQDRAAAGHHEGHLLGRRAVPGARRCPGSGPVAVAGQRAGDPARARLRRRPETRCRRDHSAGPHRGTGRVGRLPPAAGEAHRFAAAHDPRWAERGRRIRQLRRGQPARSGRHRARHGDQTLPGGFGARRPQHRHLQHGAQPAVAGVRAVLEQ